MAQDFKEHPWDFDDAVSVAQFYKDNGVKPKDQEYLIKECHSESGRAFTAVGFNNGEKTKEGKDAMTFFCLSRSLERKGYTLDDDFLGKHKEDIMLLEPPEEEDPDDQLKFGVLFLAGSGGRKNWNDV